MKIYRSILTIQASWQEIEGVSNNVKVCVRAADCGDGFVCCTSVDMGEWHLCAKNEVSSFPSILFIPKYKYHISYINVLCLILLFFLFNFFLLLLFI